MYIQNFYKYLKALLLLYDIIVAPLSCYNKHHYDLLMLSVSIDRTYVGVCVHDHHHHHVHNPFIHYNLLITNCCLLIQRFRGLLGLSLCFSRRFSLFTALFFDKIVFLFCFSFKVVIIIIGSVLFLFFLWFASIKYVKIRPLVIVHLL